MDEARGRQLWDMAAPAIAILKNGLQRGRGEPAVNPESIHPYMQQTKRRVDVRLNRKESMEFLKRKYANDIQ